MSPGSRPPLRAVFLDAGNTLLRMDYALIAERLAAHGIVVTPADVQRAEWRARVRLDAEVLAPAGAAASTESRSTGERYVEFLLAELGVTDAATVAAVAEWRRTYNPPIGLWTASEPGAEEALGLLREAGLRTAVISNSNGSVRRILETVGLARHLDFVLDSAEVGVEKPSPRIFELALARAGCAAAEAVYVGDLYSVDVRGARAAGLAAVLLDPGGCWGDRDCAVAANLLEAARRLVGRPHSGSVTKG